MTNLLVSSIKCKDTPFFSNNHSFSIKYIVCTYTMHVFALEVFIFVFLKCFFQQKSKKKRFPRTTYLKKCVTLQRF